MATVTKPPVKSRLTIKDAACHRLVRFLMRAYYETEHIVVVDCLLDLQVKNPNKVTESDLSSALHLSPKLVREILHRLRQDQLVKGVQQSEVLKPTEELTSRGKRKGYTRAPTVTFTWHIDFEHVVKVIKFRHVEIIEKLSKTVDKNDIYYICPTADCENHALSKKRSVMDLLLDGGAHGDGVFRCEQCFTHDPRTNLKQATPLVVLTHTETGGSADAASAAAAAAAASGGATAAVDLGSDPSENLKAKFNKQLGTILEQLRKVDHILTVDMQNKQEAAAKGELDKLAAEEAASAGVIQFANPAALAAAAATNTDAAAAAAAASSSSSGHSHLSAPQPSLEDMISVSLSGGEPAAKRVKMENVIGAMSRDVLPWDKKNPLSLAKVEQERAAQEQAQSQQQAEETRIKAEEEQKRFEAQYAHQLAKQTAAAAAAVHVASASSAAASSSDDAGGASSSSAPMEEDESAAGPFVTVNGRAVLLSAVTQEDIDQMTVEEFDDYSAHAEDMEEF